MMAGDPCGGNVAGGDGCVCDPPFRHPFYSGPTAAEVRLERFKAQMRRDFQLELQINRPRRLLLVGI